MTDYTATPEQWAAAEHYGDPGRKPRPMSEYACILELRARIEALESVISNPTSLAEQALKELERVNKHLEMPPLKKSVVFCTIRRALELLAIAAELEGGDD